MCGIVGLVGPGALRDGADRLIDRLSAPMQTRGPDGHGRWVGEGVALGHRRLSINDLSPAGHQPMVSASERYVITFNGELYNFGELRDELANAGHRFRGHSDTEILLAAVEEWGLDATLDRFDGMFAFGLWDRRERCLWLARDRLGEKPLYYGRAGDDFVFASSLAPFRAHPDFDPTLDRDAVALLLRFLCVPAPHSIHRNVRKLPAGALLRIDLDDGRPVEGPVRTWWDFAQVAACGIDLPYRGSIDDAADELGRLLESSVRRRMVADVPVGAFLSGGIDSSAVVAAMQTVSSQPVRTFTIGSPNADYDEADAARSVAAHLGTDHTEFEVGPDDALGVINDLPRIYDEPFADSSQIPTVLVSRLARTQVTVALSGDAGDELFGGYNRYVFLPRVWKRFGATPLIGRRAAAAAIRRVAPTSWDRAAGLLPTRVRPRNPGVKLDKLAAILPLDSLTDAEHRILTYWSDSAGVVLGVSPELTALLADPTRAANHPDRWFWNPPAGSADRFDPVQRMATRDLGAYLPDDILAKVDRATMSASLEGRVPFLDHRIVEWAFTLPTSLRVHDGETKRVLRHYLGRHVPRQLFDRPKTGFGVPVGEWLRGPLRSWAEDLLSPETLRRDGVFDPNAVRTAWADHTAGRADHSHRLWCVLMFQAWATNGERLFA